MKRFEFGGFVYFFGHTEYTIQRSDSKKKNIYILMKRYIVHSLRQYLGTLLITVLICLQVRDKKYKHCSTVVPICKYCPVLIV